MLQVLGGVLADEMGLGKTVELLACILAHPFPGPRLVAEKVPQLMPYCDSVPSMIQQMGTMTAMPLSLLMSTVCSMCAGCRLCSILQQAA